VYGPAADEPRHRSGRALQDAHKASGKKTYSETVNDLSREAVRVDALLRAMEDLSQHPDPWWPGYVEEYGPNPPIRNEKRRVTRVVHDPLLV
jgi:hypothetical protein